jgi:hypothetical protein
VDEMGTKAIMQLCLETCDKDRSSVKDDGIRYTMIENNVGYV